MVNLKRNILKTVVGVTCAVLPWNKLHAQTYDCIENVCEVSAVYTLKPQGDTYGYGGYVKGGKIYYVAVPESKWYGCGAVCGGVGLLHFNTGEAKNRCKLNFAIKLGAGYKRFALMASKELEFSFGNKDGTSVISLYGLGAYCSVGPYVKLFADAKWALPVVAPRTSLQDDIANQKYVFGVGLIYVLSSKTR